MKSCFVRIKGLCIMRCKIAAIADLLFIIQILNISMAVFQVSQVSEYAELEVDWVDWDQTERDQQVVYRHGIPALNALEFDSLLGGILSRQGIFLREQQLVDDVALWRLVAYLLPGTTWTI
ncbi:predicted protein [Histoplasma capsulatum G186AR]|uniref:Uncharacterized protein n=1 Tax=Ajellomyces capsulatus (strain G186AR / H82 / ATCC MYA-2454 / RMSCC 2432) TaxID=447093 RepID=C0NKU4_AJECG|nr:uncharacterized protein HCBG_03774 [Histoplasma capsulatum G186AR]EEH08485.1 predicted protein [Histoplasma capsulatum G186AR]